MSAIKACSKSIEKQRIEIRIRLKLKNELLAALNMGLMHTGVKKQPSRLGM